MAEDSEGRGEEVAVLTPTGAKEMGKRRRGGICAACCWCCLAWGAKAGRRASSSGGASSPATTATPSAPFMELAHAVLGPLLPADGAAVGGDILSQKLFLNRW